MSSTTPAVPASPAARWSRSQKLRLSEAGRAAGESFQALLVASRAEAGRASFDAACLAWASTHSLKQNDGIYLGELKDAPRTLREIVASMDGCGPSKDDIREALDRLVNARLVELVEPPPPPPAAPPYRRW